MNIRYSKGFVLRAACFVFFIYVSNNLRADTIVYNDPEETINISPFLSLYEDQSASLDFNDVINKKFKKIEADVPNLGISESVFWVKIQVYNNTEEERLLLQLSLATLDNITFYYPKPDKLYDSVQTGEHFPFYQRKYKDPDYIFNVFIPTKSFSTLYLKISSKEGIQLPINLGTQSAIFTGIKNRDILSGIYFGIMFAMIFYNLFIWLSVKDKNYIYYVIYIVLIMITQSTLQGYPFQYLWPDSPYMAQKSLFIFPSLVSMAGLAFMREFLMVKMFSRLLYVLSYLMYIPYITSILLAFAGFYKISFHMMEASSMTVSVLMLVTSISILRKGYQPAKYFLGAWVVFLVGVFIYILKDFEILPYNNFTRYTMHIGSGIETVLLSFALAARINIYKKEKETSQARALELLKENERIITGQKEMLEKKVSERTAELEASNKSLKETEAHLVNVEKMASLGQLTAGISHEINNPINFVVSNVKPLKRDMLEIMKLIEKYNEIKDEKGLKEKLEEIEQLKKQIDLDYLIEEVDLLLKGIDEGARRTSEIVKGLKNFSRTDEAHFKRANIHDGLDATLTILNNGITGANIKVIKNYGDIPEIECYPGKLNQVFMNILNNAVHAVLAAGRVTGDGQISITTSYAANNITIKIKDNGTGIPKAHLNKIFEPFFTTKPVGMGTGLGLSIVYGIIKSHNGHIDIKSEEGKGSEFIITLPNNTEKKN